MRKSFGFAPGISQEGKGFGMAKKGSEKSPESKGLFERRT
jgi:hypothetical protein